MFIVCPHCATSYAIDVATLGMAGRSVRCSRCKEVWLARPEDAVEAPAPIPAMAEAGAAAAPRDAADEWEALAREEEAEQPPEVESPSIAAGWPEDAVAEDPADSPAEAEEPAQSRLARLGRLTKFIKRPALPDLPGKKVFSLPVLTAAMAALTVALVIWRADVVRLMPQTASFYKLVGLEVNLRGVAFKDVKVATETVDGKPVLVIEGTIVSTTKKAVDLPRLRFSVRDAQGAEIYAWNTLLEQTVLKPGERAAFKSRLASPPPEGRNIDIRFFNRRDLAAGSA
ncbi:thioredoxin [Bradyrhizobium sp. SSBR45G]|uniref:MJ0042-type zinc finger domain-containing protein n=1 Tax=unclassified Bradyrhizobium TaxID=2631580 RepID=UPI0023429C4B|nr:MULTISPECIES: MJ0042-type zinc finger domain-containing protein [unclassified Bradyrhizobium]GLH82388.1 thioredoxin [Bradyrhizobium sp. SSBR45G]GLH89821.1 thioredoxin [Bradyrhizobium sp. SSBR45R]